jgi:hypothetical protein
MPERSDDIPAGQIAAAKAALAEKKGIRRIAAANVAKPPELLRKCLTEPA